MKNILIFFLAIILLTSSAICQEAHVIPIKVKRNITIVTVKIGDIEIPDILLDTGLSFDGILIYNPNYKDSLDLTNSIEVSIGGAGDGAVDGVQRLAVHRHPAAHRHRPDQWADDGSGGTVASDPRRRSGGVIGPRVTTRP